jgi:meso-butanediol dehydrogenase/(S,S)-butanediol dehydrogenase/diacetyl reductase
MWGSVMRLKGKVALVTGAAAGIGAGIAERLVEAGASVSVFDIDGEGGQKHAARLLLKGQAIAITGDVASEDDVQRAVEETATRLGTLDVLVNNAGIEIADTITSFKTADWDRLLSVNLKGAFLFCKHAIPKMAGRGGSIINISSVRAFVSYAGGIAYDSSKAALIGFTRTLALDHGKDGIRVNAICPGYIQTPMTDHWLSTLEDPEGTMKQLLAFHPLGRIGTPRDVADAALFLASDAAAFVTGAALIVDGGMSTAGH